MINPYFNLPIIFTILAVGSFIGYFLTTRKLIKRLIDYGMLWKSTAERLDHELKTLTDQYRQLAKINQAQKDIIQTKKGGKK